jgi:hypothetical protein
VDDSTKKKAGRQIEGIGRYRNGALTFRTLFRSSEAILTEPPEERGGRAMTRAFQSTSLFDFPFSSS